MKYILTCAHKAYLCVCVVKTQLQCFFKSSEHNSTKYFVVPVHPKLWLNDLHLPQVIFLYLNKKNLLLQDSNFSILAIVREKKLKMACQKNLIYETRTHQTT